MFERSSNTTTGVLVVAVTTQPCSMNYCQHIHPQPLCANSRIMSAKAKNVKAKNNTIKPGDEFYETDDDVIQRVVSVHADRDPPVALCRSTKSDSESETEQEYDLKYVQGCVSKRKDFIAKGFDKLDAKRIYKLTAKQLQEVLFYAKQKCTGTKAELRTRLCFFMDVVEITTSCTSGEDNEETSDDGEDNKLVEEDNVDALEGRDGTNNVDCESGSDSEETDTEDDSEEDWVSPKKKRPQVKNSSAEVVASSANGAKKKQSGKTKTSKRSSSSQSHSTRKKTGTAKNKRKRKRGKKKPPKHFAVWKKLETVAQRAGRTLPEHAWRHRAIPRSFAQVCV